MIFTITCAGDADSDYNAAKEVTIKHFINQIYNIPRGEPRNIVTNEICGFAGIEVGCDNRTKIFDYLDTLRGNLESKKI